MPKYEITLAIEVQAFDPSEAEWMADELLEPVKEQTKKLAAKVDSVQVVEVNEVGS